MAQKRKALARVGGPRLGRRDDLSSELGDVGIDPWREAGDELGRGDACHCTTILNGMSRVVDGACQSEKVRPDATQRSEAKRLREAIARVGFVLPGTLAQRRTRCGYAGCHCHAEPPQLHGPYWFWTRKVAAKTVTRLLTDEQVADYQAWFDNAKTLRSLVSELETLSLRIVESDPRSARRPGGRKPGAH